jgi:hypothetical protein
MFLNTIFTAPWSKSLVMTSTGCFILLSVTSVILFIKLCDRKDLRLLIVSMKYLVFMYCCKI